MGVGARAGRRRRRFWSPRRSRTRCRSRTSRWWRGPRGRRRPSAAPRPPGCSSPRPRRASARPPAPSRRSAAARRERRSRACRRASSPAPPIPALAPLFDAFLDLLAVLLSDRLHPLALGASLAGSRPVDAPAHRPGCPGPGAGSSASGRPARAAAPGRHRRCRGSVCSAPGSRRRCGRRRGRPSRGRRATSDSSVRKKASEPSAEASMKVAPPGGAAAGDQRDAAAGAGAAAGALRLPLVGVGVVVGVGEHQGVVGVEVDALPVGGEDAGLVGDGGLGARAVSRSRRGSRRGRPGARWTGCRRRRSAPRPVAS